MTTIPAAPFRVVFALFPRITQLDFTGPHEVLWRAPGARCVLASAAGGPVSADGGLVFDTVRLAELRTDLGNLRRYEKDLPISAAIGANACSAAQRWR